MKNKVCLFWHQWVPSEYHIKEAKFMAQRILTFQNSWYVLQNWIPEN